jgi:dephospho-CoA kinase
LRLCESNVEAVSAQHLVLLGGGIGSGKSTAAGVFAALGAAVFSADEAGHRALEPGRPGYLLVSERWPDVIVHGRVDRAALAAVVFADAAALQALEAASHPAIREYLSAEIGKAEAEVVVVETPLARNLFGPGWLWVVVDASDQLRVERLLDQGMSRRQIEVRMKLQASRREWLQIADIVVDNSGDLDHLERECQRAWEKILS